MFLYIYFHDIFTELAGIIKIINSPLSTILFLCQKLLKNRKCLNFFMFLQGAQSSKCAMSDQGLLHTWLTFVDAHKVSTIPTINNHYNPTYSTPSLPLKINLNFFRLVKLCAAMSIINIL